MKPVTSGSSRGAESASPRDGTPRDGGSPLDTLLGDGFREDSARRKAGTLDGAASTDRS